MRKVILFLALIHSVPRAPRHVVDRQHPDACVEQQNRGEQSKQKFRCFVTPEDKTLHYKIMK